MNMFECTEIIAKAISEFVEKELISMGYNAQGLRSQLRRYEDIATSTGGIYGVSLIYQGIGREEQRAINNPPSWSFGIEVERKLTAVFDTLDLPTTQSQAFNLSRRLQRNNDILKVVGYDRLKKLLQPETSPLRIKEVMDWCGKASVAVSAISVNLETKQILASITQEQVEFAKGLSFDWYYSYSDDIGVWRAGKNAHARVREWATSEVFLNPKLLSVVKQICTQYDFPLSFFIDREAGGWDDDVFFQRLMSSKHHMD